MIRYTGQGEIATFRGIDSISQHYNQFEIVVSQISERDEISIGIAEEMFPVSHHPGIVVGLEMSIGYSADQAM